jgi:hypothetical protein
MRPTRRNRVALGKTWARADRTLSIRVTGVATPSPTLPPIEPEASNTSMASSLQAVGFFSSAQNAELKANSAAEAEIMSLMV